MKIVLFCTLLFSGFITKAQIGMFNSALYPSLKNSSLIVEMEVNSSESGKLMKEAVSSAWKVSTVEFVDPANFKMDLKQGVLYATLDHSQTSMQFIRENIGTGGQWYSSEINNDYFYILFWMLTDNYDASKGLLPKNKKIIARAELYLKSIGTGNIIKSSRNIGSASFGDDFCNGLPGYIKNIFQQVSNNIDSGVESKLKKDIKSLPELAKLQKDTLYVPNYWYGPGGTMLPGETDQSANGKYFRKLIESYDHPIKVVRRDDLSNMILNANKPVYYFNYIQSSADKMISVINGFTGETLYYDFNDKSYRPKAKDYKNVSEAVSAAN